MLKTAVFCFRGAISFYKAIVLRARMQAALAPAVAEALQKGEPFYG